MLDQRRASTRKPKETASAPQTNEQIAEQGLRAPGTRLPDVGRYSALGGSVDAIQTHSGKEATAACQRFGVPAFSYQGDIVLKDRSAPTHVLDHEAYHASRQRTGTLSSDSTPSRSPSDRSEQESDSFAAGMAPPSPTASSVPRLAFYTEVPTDKQRPDYFQAGEDLRVADDGKMAVVDTEHDAWAEAGIIRSANRKLQSQNSILELTPDGNANALRGLRPPGRRGSAARTLHKVRVKNKKNKSETAAKPKDAKKDSAAPQMSIYNDCGECARSIMGSSNSAYDGEKITRGVYRGKAQLQAQQWADRLRFFVKFAGMKELKGLLKFFEGLAKPKTTRPAVMTDSPDGIRNLILRDLMDGVPAATAWKAYQQLKGPLRETVDAAAGLNRHALPDVGEAYAVVSDRSQTRPRYNFHWGAVVLKSGHDRVTLENSHSPTGGKENTDWEFHMYGPPSKRGQTFHDQNDIKSLYGPDPVTVRARR